MSLLPMAIGLIFSTLAAIAAFLITYNERTHHFTSRRESLRYGIKAAIAAFLVFMAMTMLAAFFISRL
jgi:ABC-type nickel/cobalt efflux system permease component RcnA